MTGGSAAAGRRLFLAIELDEVVRREAGRVAAGLSRALAAVGGDDVSWVRPDNMHLTIRFLGDTPHSLVPRLVQAFLAPLAAPAFRLGVGGLGTFPPRGPARVIWIRIETGLEQLAAVHREAENRLAALGIGPEDRPFHAHLTLGRVRGRLGARAAGIIGGMAVSDLPGSDAREVTLFESRLSPRGATYTALSRAALGAAREEHR